MNLFQILFNRLHSERGLIEITALDNDRILIVADGREYGSYSELPVEYRNHVDSVLAQEPQAFSIVHRAGYCGDSAVDAILRCLYGSFDASPDMDFNRSIANPEYPSHCSSCKFDTMFCLRKIGALAPRETEIALMIRQGFTDKEISDRTGKSENTIRNQRRAIERKLRSITGQLANSTTITQYVNQYGG